MSPSERDPSANKSSPGGTRPDSSEQMGSNADSEDSAAHIAELVRRTSERLAAPEPSRAAQPEATIAEQIPQPAEPVGQPPAESKPSPLAATTRPPVSTPSRRTLVVVGAVIAVLLVGGVALSHSFGSPAPKATSPKAQSSAPAGYTVKVSDVVTDCASHSRGKVKASFATVPCVKATRSLATGRISGRPALFVVSQIKMPSPEAAASVKQVLDGSGTGNLNDLLREGKTFPGAPPTMPISGYTSVQLGTVVTVVEVGFSDGGPSSSTDAALRAGAAQVAAMVSKQK